MRIKLLHDAVVRFPSGSELEVSEEEGKRLIAFGNGVEVKAEEKAAAPQKKKTAAAKKK